MSCRTESQRARRGVLVFCGLLLLTANANASPTVGAYYYPWWDENVSGGHKFDETLRAHLTPNAQLPEVGIKSSRDDSLISTHIDQSHVGNISMWSLSWWGPDSFEDTTIRNSIFPHPRASELSYTINYESQGRLGSMNSPDYSNLVPDFRYLADNIFANPNYMRIDGRPVVVMYLSRVYFDDPTGLNALSGLRTMMQAEYGYDPYIIGDHVFGGVAPGASGFDAITAYDIYGQAFSNGISDQGSIDDLELIYDNAQTLANLQGVDFVPGVSPGFNDRGVREGNLPAPRYLDALGPSAPGTVFESMLTTAALPHTDADIGELILVNSFNEWHEDTQIEPTIISPSTNKDDSSSGSEFTEGRFYEGYGNRYLDILSDQTGIAGDLNEDGVLDGNDYAILMQDMFVAPTSELPSDLTGDGSVDFHDHQAFKNIFDAVIGADSFQVMVSSNSVPEPTTFSLLAASFLTIINRFRLNHNETFQSRKKTWV